MTRKENIRNLKIYLQEGLYLLIRHYTLRVGPPLTRLKGCLKCLIGEAVLLGLPEGHLLSIQTKVNLQLLLRVPRSNKIQKNPRKKKNQSKSKRKKPLNQSPKIPIQLRKRNLRIFNIQQLLLTLLKQLISKNKEMKIIHLLFLLIMPKIYQPQSQIFSRNTTTTITKYWNWTK